ncbi:MAG TPA: hypothetical protein VGH28_22170 [Polyangiaceae bacterium]|jgi:hypothetical protein
MTRLSSCGGDDGPETDAGSDARVDASDADAHADADAGEDASSCDAGTVSCFIDPCQTKKIACVAGQCIVE